MESDSWVNMQQYGQYEGTVEFNDNMFFNYSPLVLETSSYAYESSELDHTERLYQPFHVQGNAQKVPNSSPLGLTLRKTPSLLTMFETKLFKENRGSHHSTAENGTRKVNIPSSKTSEQSFEKLKASNFGVSSLKIGKWQRVKRFEGDLVAKCYFAKKKLVWEVLEGALKSKIEIQWCDIIGMRAQMQDPNQPGVLEIELSQPPMFYHESDPKPRKHTCWQPCPDFTGGQALSIRRHYVTFPPGTLDGHYNKLLQSDIRLFELSKRTFPTLESPYFPSHYSDFSTFSFEPNGFVLHDPQGLMNYPRTATHDAPNFIIPSHSSPKPSTRFNVPSRSTFSDYTTYNHQCDTLETTQWNTDPAISCHHFVEAPTSGSIDDIEKHLLNDTQYVPFDEHTLLVKVRSMCSLLDYPTQATSNCNSNYMEPEYENIGYSDNIQMENCWSDESNGFAYSQCATLGSCMLSFNEELTRNCPYF